IDRSDMTLGRAGADLGRQQGANAGAGRRLGRQQVDALLAAPAGIASDGRDDLAAHGFGVLGGVQQGAGLGERVLVMDLEGIVVDAWGWLLHGDGSFRGFSNRPSLTLSGSQWFSYSVPFLAQSAKNGADLGNPGE